MDWKLVTVIFLLASCVSAVAQNGGARIVRIPTPFEPRCINAKTDQLTVTLRHVKTQRRTYWFREDNKAGVTVITTLNADGNPTAKNPSVTLVDIAEATPGQIFLPLEYPIASRLALSPDSGRTFTGNIQLAVYIDRVQGRNTFGKILDAAGQLLPKLPIPSNPYTTAVSSVIGFASSIIEKETTDNGGQLLASVTLQFNDRDQSSVDQCISSGFEATGAIGVIGEGVLDLNRLTGYCLRYNTNRTYEIQYADRPAGQACKDVADSSYMEVPNDHLMLVVSAQKVLPASPAVARPADELLSRRMKDFEESRKLCEALKLAPTDCGAD